MYQRALAGPLEDDYLADANKLKGPEQLVGYIRGSNFISGKEQFSKGKNSQ